jgi:hypothetical protein
LPLQHAFRIVVRIGNIRSTFERYRGDSATAPDAITLLVEDVAEPDREGGSFP